MEFYRKRTNFAATGAIMFFIGESCIGTMTLTIKHVLGCHPWFDTNC